MPREREGIAKQGRTWNRLPPGSALSPCESLSFTSHELPLSEDVGPLGKVQEAVKCLAQTSLCGRCGLLGNSKMGVTYNSLGN